MGDDLVTANPHCELCDGTGWISAEDPVLGGYVDCRCPECDDPEEADHADT